jgi:hypothetical protein
MSVFPAAATLAETGFDLGHLIDQPGYSEGGPNVHSFSLITWITAAFIAVLGDGGTLFPALHLLHFAITALAMTVLFRFAATFLDPGLAGLATLAVLVFPLVLTQAGFMYLEMPVLATTALAMLAWQQQRPVWVVVWVTAAVLVKGSGLAVALALGGATLLDSPPRNRRVVWSFVTVAAPIAIVLSMPISAGLGTTRFREHVVHMVQYLIRIPDLLVLLLAYVLLSSLFVRRRRHEDIDQGEDRAEVTNQTTSWYATSFLVVAFFLFYLALPLAGNGLIVVPRYYVQLVPFVILGLAGIAARRYHRGFVVAVLIVFIAWTALNRNGTYYPDNDINNFPLAERSGAYVELIELHRVETRELEALPAGVPVIYDQPTHIRFSYPLLGYAEKPLRDGINIVQTETLRNIEDFPEEFYLLYEYPWLGGDLIRAVWRQAEEEPGRHVQIRDVRAAQYRSRLIHVTSEDTP